MKAWRSVPRVVRGTLITVCCTLVGWIVLVNLLLWTGAVERLVSGHHGLAEVELKIGRAWMLRPDTVHVREFELDIDGYAIRVHVEVVEGEARVAFFDLLSRTFRTRSITGRAGTIAVQRKMPHDEVDERRLARFPQLGSFDRPVRAAEVPDLPAYDEALRVRLEGVDVELDEVWVDEFRLEPAHGRVEGNLETVVGNAFGVWDATVDVKDTEVSIAEHEPLIVGMDLHLAVEVEEYDPFERRGRKAFAQVTGEVKGSGRVRDVSSCAVFLPPRVAKLVLAGGEGPIDVAATIDSGVLQPGALLTWETESLRVLAGKLIVGSRMHLGMRVEEEDGDVTSRADVKLEGVHGGVAGTDGSRDGVVAPEIEAFVAFAQADLAAPDWALSDVGLSIPRLRIADLGILVGVTDALESMGGSLELTWKTSRLEDGRFGHDATIEAPGFSMTTSDVSVRSSTKAKLGARTNPELTETTVGKLHVELDRIGIDTPNGKSDGAWLRIARGKVVLQHETGTIDARLRGRLDDLRPVLIHSSTRRALVETLPDHDLAQPLAFDVGVHSTHEGVTLNVDDLSRPALNIRGTLRKVGEQIRFAFELRHARIGVHGVNGGKPAVDLAVADDWLETKARWVESLGPGTREKG